MFLIDDEFEIFIENEFENLNKNLLNKKRSGNLEELSLNDLISNKNPYNYLTLGFVSSKELIDYLLNIRISESRETKLGIVLENISIYIIEKLYKGKKSNINGIDFEFTKNNKYYLVQLKSAPNWGNSSQIKEMKNQFSSALSQLNINSAICINACCSGNSFSSPDYIKMCGQDYWRFISENDEFYIKLMEILNKNSLKYKFNSSKEYLNLSSKLCKEFESKFYQNGIINISSVMKFNAGSNNKYKKCGKI